MDFRFGGIQKVDEKVEKKWFHILCDYRKWDKILFGFGIKNRDIHIILSTLESGCSSLVPRPPSRKQEARERPGKTYHVSDVTFLQCVGASSDVIDKTPTHTYQAASQS